jgi:hypothetical protein
MSSCPARSVYRVVRRIFIHTGKKKEMAEEWRSVIILMHHNVL